MEKHTKKTIHLIYEIAVGAVIVVAAVCIMAACVGIYRSGDSPYTRESVAESFSAVAIPVYLCIVLIIGGFILDLICPAEKRRTLPEKNYALILRKLREKTDLSKSDEVLRNAICTQRYTVILHKTASIVLLAVGSIVFLIYALDSGNFHQTDINSSVIKAVALMGACLIVPFTYAVFTSFYTKKSMKKEIELLKQARKCESTAVITDAETEALQKYRREENKEVVLLVARCVVFAAAVAVLIYGFATGGAADVLTKAVNICTECIGLG